MKFLIATLAAVLSLATITEANIDIANFDKIYVRYHNCAWSAYNGDCGANNNGGDLWYLGLTECFRANAAYSLYGVVRGAEDKGCSKATYLNSFFTTGGVDAFVQTLQNAGVAVNQQGEQQGDDANQEQQAEINGECQAVEGEQQEQQEDGENYDWATNNRKMFDGTTSVGVGCSGSHFAVKTYNGAYCDERAAIAVTDELTDFNQGLDAAQCVVIYNGSAQNDDANGDQVEEELELLQNSEACNVRFYPESCPDPYGKLSFQARSTARDVAIMTSPVGERIKMAFSWILLSIGTIFMGASAWACWNKSKSNSAKLDLTEEASVKSSRSGGWLSRKARSSDSTQDQSSNSGNTSPVNRKRRCLKFFRRNN